MLSTRLEIAAALTGPDAPARDFYRMLEAYYFNNGLYDSTQQQLYENGIWTPGMKPLRNPAKRTVEFHVTHIWPGNLDHALPILTDNQRIIEPLKQVWKWSNWGVKKQLASRWFALFGDWFCKVATLTDTSGKVSRVFLQNIKPELVTDFEEDERGNVVYMRLDIPYTSGVNQTSGKMYTEIWTRTEYTLYIHNREAGAAVASMGEPVRIAALSDFGIDFVPFVHAAFMDLGDKRGVGVFTLALDKIDEANRMTTRLHQMIFRYGKPTVAVLANGTDAAGRPLPPPKVGGSAGGMADEKDDDVKSFPGTSRMEYLVPNLNYAAHLDIINAQMRELEEDLPELSYYRQKELGSSISGKAVRLLLSQAVDRTIEARANLEVALERADKMALTMAVTAGLFKRIGKYEAGDFEHTFAEREVIPFSAQESADTMAAEVGAGVPVALAARRQGWPEEQLKELSDATEAAQNAGGVN